MVQTEAVMDIREGLNDQQWMFCVEYLKRDCNAYQAALAAGYAESTAQSNSYALLENMGIRRAINGLLINAGYTPEFVKAKFQAYARANVEDFEPWIEGECTLAELRKRGVDTSCVKSASLTYSKSGQPIRRITLHSGLDAVRDLAKCHKLYEDSGGDSAPAGHEVTRRVVIEEFAAKQDEPIDLGVEGLPPLVAARFTGGPSSAGGNGKSHHGNGHDSKS